MKRNGKYWHYLVPNDSEEVFLHMELFRELFFYDNLRMCARIVENSYFAVRTAEITFIVVVTHVHGMLPSYY